MQGYLYIAVTDTYLNTEYDLFTATEDNELFRTITRASREYISEIIEEKTVSETHEISSTLT